MWMSYVHCACVTVCGDRRIVKTTSYHARWRIVREAARCVDGVDLQGSDQWWTRTTGWITLTLVGWQRPGHRRQSKVTRHHVYSIETALGMSQNVKNNMASTWCSVTATVAQWLQRPSQRWWHELCRRSAIGLLALYFVGVCHNDETQNCKATVFSLSVRALGL